MRSACQVYHKSPVNSLSLYIYGTLTPSHKSGKTWGKVSGPYAVSRHEQDTDSDTKESEAIMVLRSHLRSRPYGSPTNVCWTERNIPFPLYQESIIAQLSLQN